MFPSALANDLTLPFYSPSFKTAVAAAKAAADIYNPVSITEDREYMGAIIRRKDSYYFTVTAGRKGKDTVTIRVQKSIWSHVVGLWHTHGRKAPHHRFFSDVDTTLVKDFRLPFYLADYTGSLKVFRPGDHTLSPKEANRLGLPRRNGYAVGVVVRDRHNRVVTVNVAPGEQPETGMAANDSAEAKMKATSEAGSTAGFSGSSEGFAALQI